MQQRKATGPTSTDPGLILLLLSAQSDEPSLEPDGESSLGHPVEWEFHELRVHLGPYMVLHTCQCSTTNISRHLTKVMPNLLPPTITLFMLQKRRVHN